MFKHRIPQITEPLKLKAASPEKIAHLRKEFASVPTEYFIFLEEVGWGNIGGMMMYHGLLDPNDILPPADQPWERVVIFGDDWQGSCFGFDLDNGELVEITPSGEIESTEREFREFISGYAN